MNLLQRYIFKQVLVATVMAVGIFVFVLVLGNVMKEVLERLASGQIDLPTFLYLLVLLIPGVVPYALPLGLLTAVLLVVGRLCAQREYTAMRAAGLSLWTLAAPILLVACLGVLLCVFINFDYAPAADYAFRTKLVDILQNDPQHLFQPGRDVREFPGYILNIGDRNGDNLKDVWGWVLDDKGRVQKFGHGDRGKITKDDEHKELVLTVYDASGYQYNSTNPEDFSDASHGVLKGDMEFHLPLAKLSGPIATPFKLSLMTLGDLLKLREGTPPQPHAAGPSHRHAGPVGAMEQGPRPVAHGCADADPAQFCRGFFGAGFGDVRAAAGLAGEPGGEFCQPRHRVGPGVELLLSAVFVHVAPHPSRRAARFAALAAEFYL